MIPFILQCCFNTISYIIHLTIIRMDNYIPNTIIKIDKQMTQVRWFPIYQTITCIGNPV